MNLQIFTTQIVLTLGFLTICEAWQSYSSIYSKRPTSYPWGHRRGPSLDRLSMNFIKRSNDLYPEYTEADYRDAINAIVNAYQDNDDMPSVYTSYPKRHFDRISSEFVRKRRSTDATADGNQAVNEGSEVEQDSSTTKHKRYVDRMTSAFIKKDNGGLSNEMVHNEDDMSFMEDEKQALDRLSGFVKRPFDRLTGFVKRPFGRLTGFVKRPFGSMSEDQTPYDKRHFDRMSTGFIKRDFGDSGYDVGDDYEIDKRRLDRLSSSFVKKDDAAHEGEKRRLDRLSAFVKKSKTNAYDDGVGAEKRRLDRISSFVKKSENDGQIEEEKRRLDRLSSFVKKSETDGYDSPIDEGKRRLDRLTGFVKKSETDANSDHIEPEKRRLDRLSSFVKKSDKTVGPYDKSDISDMDNSKRRFDRLSSSFVKRRLDRMSSSFLKRSDEDSIENDKRYIDRMNSFI